MIIEHNSLHQVLNERFHFKNFRPGQLEAISVLLQHKSLLSIQPTGHGKSLLYQLPSILLEGMSVVISPLLALMRDQIQQDFSNNTHKVIVATNALGMGIDKTDFKQKRGFVTQHMTCLHEQPLPTGTLLVLDDYIGSGATLTEAVRVLRKESHFQGKIVPFTIAQVKWRLGKAGMI